MRWVVGNTAQELELLIANNVHASVVRLQPVDLFSKDIIPEVLANELDDVHLRLRQILDVLGCDVYYPSSKPNSYVFDFLVQLLLQLVAKDLATLDGLVLLNYTLQVFVDQELVEGINDVGFGALSEVDGAHDLLLARYIICYHYL